MCENKTIIFGKIIYSELEMKHYYSSIIIYLTCMFFVKIPTLKTTSNGRNNCTNLKPYMV